MRWKLLLGTLALATAACGSSATEQAGAPADVQSEGQRALHTLSELNRAIALKRAIHGHGIQCQRIERSAYVREHKKLSMWAASCNDGRSWALFVGRDDSVQVRDCKQLKALELPSCPAWTEQAQRKR